MDQVKPNYPELVWASFSVGRGDVGLGGSNGLCKFK